jgi:four helix bundle protein
MKIRSHRELEAYILSFDIAMKNIEISKGFPKEETYSLTDQIRRSSRSVCANLAEAFRNKCINVIQELTDFKTEQSDQTARP